MALSPNSTKQLFYFILFVSDTTLVLSNYILAPSGVLSVWSAGTNITIASAPSQIAHGLRLIPISITVISSSPGYASLAVPTLTLNLLDTNARTCVLSVFYLLLLLLIVCTFAFHVPAGFSFTPSSFSFSLVENGVAASWHIALSSQPISPVTVSFPTSSAVTISPSSVTLSSSNWNSGFDVQVRCPNLSLRYLRTCMFVCR